MKSSRTPVQRVDFLLEQCAGKRVLHLGCTNWPYTEQSLGDGSLLHSRIAATSSSAFGIDADERGIDLLRSKGFEHLFCADLERLNECDIDEQFDVIIAGEMIEHLNNPGLFLHGVKRFMDSHSLLIITTINAYCAVRFLIYGLRGKGGKQEPVHPDHVAYYSLSTLMVLLSRNGLVAHELLFYDIGSEHRPYNRAILNLANDLAVKISPQLSDGIIAVCSRSK